jgi:hypothetical protein
MTRNGTTTLPLIIALNLLPVAGVLWWGWTAFSVFYLFWLETLIVAFFNTLKIIMCRGDEYDLKIEKSNAPFATLHVNYASHLKKAFGYLFVRIFIFCFYLLFIVVFIGVISASKDDTLTNAQIGLFLNKSFNYALLGFFIAQALDFVFEFILNDEYRHTHASDFASIFDGRQLVVHVAVVLGGVLGGFAKNWTGHEYSTWIPLFVVVIFCLSKTIFEIFKYKGGKLIIKNRKEA